MQESDAAAAEDAPFPLHAEGGLHAAEAVELLRAFYVRGNPNGAYVSPLTLYACVFRALLTRGTAPKPHRTLQLELDVSALGRPREGSGQEHGSGGAAASGKPRT